jgi:energy-converting hydrogenase Eha subunit C
MTSEIKEASEPKKRSVFVTVLAWLFIVMSGFTTLISIFQNIVIHLLFQKVKPAESTQQLSGLEGLVYNHINLIFLLYLLVSIACFVSSIALLRRKKWARIIFIFLMTIGIIWNIVSSVLEFITFTPSEFGLIITWLLMALGMSVLFGWIIHKLASNQIKTEFI